MPVAQIDLIHMIGNASVIVQLVLLLLLFFRYLMGNYFNQISLHQKGVQTVCRIY